MQPEAASAAAEVESRPLGQNKEPPRGVALCFLAASDRIRPDKSLPKQEIEGFGNDLMSGSFMEF